MDATSYLVLTNSASKRTLFPSHDKENDSDDSIGHMSPLSSSPDRYSSPTHSPRWSSPLKSTPSPLRQANHNSPRKDLWQLRNQRTPLKSLKSARPQRSPKISADVLKSDLVDETPEKDPFQTKVLMSPFSCLGSKTNKTIKHTVLETPETASVRKTIFTPLKHVHKRSHSFAEANTDVKRPAPNPGGATEPIKEIPKKIFYKSLSKVRTSLFSENIPATIPIVRNRSHSPVAVSVRSNYHKLSSGNRGLKRRRPGEINSGVWHKIKRPKLKQIEQIKLPKITPQDRIEEYLENKSAELAKPDHSMDVEQPVEDADHGSSPDPSKKFFKTNRTLAMNRKATVSVVDTMKIQVTNGKFILNAADEQKRKSCKKGNKTLSKMTKPLFEDMIPEPVPDIVKESVQSILEKLDETVEAETPSSSLNDKDEISVGELQKTPSSGIVALTASTSSLVLDDNGSQSPAEGKQLYPLFYKNSPHNSKKSNVATPARKKIVRSAKKWKATGTDQYIIDAGQKRFGATQCKECGVVYHRGDAEDERSHYNLHNNIQNLKFTGWQDENVIHSYSDGRVVVIQPNDSRWKLNKMNQVLDVVNRELGVVDPHGQHLLISKMFLFVRNRVVVGCVVAHPRIKAYKMLTVGTEDIDCCSTESYPVKCGVSHLWTAKAYRKSGIATRLMDCLRLSFLYGGVLEKNDIAFSVPSNDGKAFAVKYTGTHNFLVYN